MTMLQLGILSDGAWPNKLIKSGGGSGAELLDLPRRSKPVVKVDLYYESESKKPIIRVSKPTS